MLEDGTTLEFPAHGLASVPFSFAHGLLLCRAAGPGGRPLSVLIDTGTDPSAIDLRLARRLALRMGGSGLGRGAVSDSVAFTEAVLPWLRLGELTVRDLYAPALDLGTLPFPVDVVLGYNVLQQVSLRIDYRQQQLVLAHLDVTPPPISPHGAILPLAFFEHFPALRDLQVDQQHIGLATIDTGSNGALTVAPDLAPHLGLHAGAHDVTATEAAGFGGGGTVFQRFCREVRMGPFTLADVPLDVHFGATGDFSRAGRVNIGNQLLARFGAVAFDYWRATLTLGSVEGLKR